MIQPIARSNPPILSSKRRSPWRRSTASGPECARRSTTRRSTTTRMVSFPANARSRYSGRCLRSRATMTSCRTLAGCSELPLAADGLPSRRRRGRDEAACPKNRQSDVHVKLPQLGHISRPIPKHSSQSRHKASCRSGRCTRGAGGRTWLIIDVRIPQLVQGRANRSEEHTSELQSLAYLVCRLLLEKKKKKERDTAHRHSK